MTAIAILVTGGLLAVKRAAEARRQQATAERQRRAVAQRLASDALKDLDTLPQASLANAAYAVQLGIEHHDPVVPAARQALWDALAAPAASCSGVIPPPS